MTTPELLTKEEERVWLATYEASLSKDAGIKRSMDVAMEAVQEWRKVAPPGRIGSAEDDVRGTLRDTVQTLRDEMAALETANGELRQDVADLRSKLAVVNDLHDKAVAARDRLLSERNSLQEDLVAVKERIRSLEVSSAACHQDLAAVREALGVHNSPERSAAECVRPVVAELRALYNASLRAK